MASFTTLPVELLARIIDYFPLSGALPLRLVSRHINIHITAELHRRISRAFLRDNYHVTLHITAPEPNRAAKTYNLSLEVPHIEPDLTTKITVSKEGEYHAVPLYWGFASLGYYAVKHLTIGVAVAPKDPDGFCPDNPPHPNPKLGEKSFSKIVITEHQDKSLPVYRRYMVAPAKVGKASEEGGDLEFDGVLEFTVLKLLPNSRVTEFANYFFGKGESCEKLVMVNERLVIPVGLLALLCPGL